MGMSTSIQGFIPATDPDYKKHAAVLTACLDAGIKKLPEETAAYFGSNYPEKYLLEEKLEVNIPNEPFSLDGQQGFEVYLNQIPKGVEKIRFTNSW